jgi:metallo-beta-lactamase class B
VLHDADEIKLGDITIQALLTPGHTKGSTTYVTKVTVDEKTYTVVFPDGTSVNPGYRVARNPSYSGIGDDYRRTFRVLEALQPDIWLTPHNDDCALDIKLLRSREQGVQAWIDPQGYRNWVDDKRKKFETCLHNEQSDAKTE